MAIKYEILRYGDPSDRSPNGDFGIVLIAMEGPHNSARTVFCLVNHKHSKSCAVALLDSEFDKSGKTLREVLATELASRTVGAQTVEDYKTKFAPLPQKIVNVREDGKDVERMTDNKDLT